MIKLILGIIKGYKVSLPLHDGQQIPWLGSGGFGSLQLRAGHCGGRQEMTPCCQIMF